MVLNIENFYDVIKKVISQSGLLRDRNQDKLVVSEETG